MEKNRFIAREPMRYLPPLGIGSGDCFVGWQIEQDRLQRLKSRAETPPTEESDKTSPPVLPKAA